MALLPRDSNMAVYLVVNAHIASGGFHETFNCNDDNVDVIITSNLVLFILNALF